MDLLTEAMDPRAVGLDERPDAEVLSCLLEGQVAALNAVGQALGPIAEGAGLMVTALRGGGRLFYAGAGSSALMANADGLELAGTFGIDPDRVRLCMAGGLPQDAEMPGGVEDDLAQADADATDLKERDVLIAVAASGRTPYTLRMAQRAQAAGAATVCIANLPGAEIFRHATVAICLPTPPELVAGSTRMGAGTAQKAALNMMSTLMGIRLGHVHDGMMVNLRADNDKLRARARAIVGQIAGVSDDRAALALSQTEGETKPAILLAIAALSPDDAHIRLNKAQGHLRTALQEVACPGVTGAGIQTRTEKEA